VRKIARRDRNHSEIVKAFRKLGWSVLDLAQLGGGCPDLLVGCGKRNILVEVKDGTKPQSQRELTDDQVKFWNTWRGEKRLVESIEDVLSVVRG
jgi:Holliday junction resolvase